MNVAVLDPGHAHGLRLLLIAEHLDLFDEDDLFIAARHLGGQNLKPELEQRARDIWSTLEQQLGDPLVALNKMIAQAHENLRRFQAKQPLVGHLLPYFTREEAQAAGLPFTEKVGWLETEKDEEKTKLTA